MPFSFEGFVFPGVVLVTPRVFPDERGYFLETYKQPDFVEGGVPERFVQENHSLSKKDTVRGLHYQIGPSAQGKLVQVILGEILDVIVDIERDSPTFGKVGSIRLSAENKLMLYVPPTFAHGFCVTSDTAYVSYKVTQLYAPDSETGIIWNDPDLAVDWPTKQAIVSAKDQALPTFSEFLNGP